MTKYLGLVFAALLCQSSFAIDCSYDSPNSTDSSTIEITKNDDGTYLFALAQVKGSESESVAYDGVTCDVSEKSPLILSCMATEELDQEDVRIHIETQITRDKSLGDTLSVLVDTTGAIEEATGGALGAALKKVSTPVASCKY